MTEDPTIGNITDQIVAASREFDSIGVELEALEQKRAELLKHIDLLQGDFDRARAELLSLTPSTTYWHRANPVPA